MVGDVREIVIVQRNLKKNVQDVVGVGNIIEDQGDVQEREDQGDALEREDQEDAQEREDQGDVQEREDQEDAQEREDQEDVQEREDQGDAEESVLKIGQDLAITVVEIEKDGTDTLLVLN